jgi:ABC-2 type transport system permease protein
MSSIQELLISPLSAAEIVSGYVIAAVLRAILIANLILLVSLIFVHVIPLDWFLYFGVTTLVAVLFAALGIILGLMAEKFDHIAILTTFVITPLVFVGGVFTSVQFLPPAFRAASFANPMFYMIDAFRYSFTGHSDAGLATSLGVVVVLAVAALAVALFMVARGHKLRV